ncbi:helix-turn-helix domain-containing protein [Sporosarcina sp. Te-1]|uniref:helix-turn-helix domain-containing protein n=1 Tax=Sporosarcina sp. Te-1 TaxID=2818390 RepID=UPI001A9EA683|nr:XRE family transcriptional regulator [Sporosarcina sp. Te-1]QTD40930.1 helix-turn-helix transcriptional regulator [Sporosarcina sp. Te-1]
MMNELGQKIRSIRKEKNLTLKEIADATGFSISFLSQLELGKSSATLESLKKIAIVLHVSPAHFFEEVIPEQTGSSFMFERIASYGIHYQNLAPGFHSPDFMPMRVILKPGEDGGQPIIHAGQEFVFVLEGVLSVEISGNQRELAKGESLFYSAQESHYWYNRSNADVIFLCVSSDTGNPNGK